MVAGSARRDESSKKMGKDGRIFHITVNKGLTTGKEDKPTSDKSNDQQENTERQHVHFQSHINTDDHGDSCSISSVQIHTVQTGIKPTF